MLVATNHNNCICWAAAAAFFAMKKTGEASLDSDLRIRPLARFSLMKSSSSLVS